MKVEQVMKVRTKYGYPSDDIYIGTFGEGYIAFIPRHGKNHTIPPHKVPYKANLMAFKTLGIKFVIATCVCGSLNTSIIPGDFVIPDQFINFTWGRDDTYTIDRDLVHLPMANPYCTHLRYILSSELKKLKVNLHDKGTVVVIQGPRFSTIAESKMFSMLGGDIVNMTQYPECYFARELGMCYSAVSSVTDYDVGIPSALSMNSESMDKVLTIFHRNTEITRLIIKKLSGIIPEIMNCDCANHQLEEYYRLSKDENLI